MLKSSGAFTERSDLTLKKYSSRDTISLKPIHDPATRLDVTKSSTIAQKVLI
jgi:hypothetical protein